MRKISLVLLSMIFFTSCSSDNSPITLVCNGIQTIDTKNKVMNSFYLTEKNKVTRTYRFTYEEKLVDKQDKSEKNKVWVFKTDSQPEIYEENKKTTLDVKGSVINVKSFRFVFVRKDDISVSSSYTKNENSKSLLESEFILNIDRITGKFTESIINSSSKDISKELVEGICVKVDKNKI
jgi:hypothetical protein